MSQTANSGGLSSSNEVSANQLQVDSILQTINRVAGSTQFAGKQLLNGSYAYTTSGTGTSAFASLQVNSALLADNKTTAVVVSVANSGHGGRGHPHRDDQRSSAQRRLDPGRRATSAANQLSFAAGTKLSAVAASREQHQGPSPGSAPWRRVRR